MLRAAVIKREDNAFSGGYLLHLLTLNGDTAFIVILLVCVMYLDFILGKALLVKDGLWYTTSNIPDMNTNDDNAMAPDFGVLFYFYYLTWWWALL